MKGSLIQSLTGLNRTLSHAMLIELGIDTMSLRQMQNGVAELNQDEVAVLLGAFENPKGKQQTAAAENFNALCGFFSVYLNATTTQEVVAGALGQDAIDTPATPVATSGEIVDDDPFGVAATPAPAAEATPPWNADDPFGTAAATPGTADIFAEASVGADPVEYDRTLLEKEADPDKVEEVPVEDTSSAADAAIFGGGA